MSATILMAPPSYASYTHRSGQGPSVETEFLPAYSRRNTMMPTQARREAIDHSFTLTEGRQTWATLRVRSSAKSAKSLPTFFEKENINGTLEIDGDKADSIHSVTAHVTGRVSSSTTSDPLQFLNIVVPVWSKSLDHPRLPSMSEGATGTKLKGRCSWDLSIAIPKEVSVYGEACRLPETLNERELGITVSYELVIKIARGKLRSDSRISTLFGYVPSIRPEAPSPLRQLAYQELSALPGPLIDPHGWVAAKPTVLRGPLFRSKDVDVKLTFYLARPLSYTRGSVIPCFAILESNQSQLLDLLSTPEALPLYLERTVNFAKGAPVQPGQTFSRSSGAANRLGSAVWWQSPVNSSGPTIRYMEGEIRLQKDLKPTASIGQFNLSYNVVLGTLKVPGFSTTSLGTGFSQPVQITTKYGPGPRPTPYSPPGFNDTSSRRRSLDPVSSPFGRVML